MHYGAIKNFDIANGTGLRVSLFVSGCRIHCKNCFNSITWDFNYGKEFDELTINKILNDLENEFIEGLSILGGEPFEEENQEGLYPLIKKTKELYPNKTIWMYSGYKLEYIYEHKKTKYLDYILNNIDILVDGPFIEELKNISLKFRGSTNQRIIDMKKSINENKIILHELNT